MLFQLIRATARRMRRKPAQRQTALGWTASAAAKHRSRERGSLSRVQAGPRRFALWTHQNGLKIFASTTRWPPPFGSSSRAVYDIRRLGRCVAARHPFTSNSCARRWRFAYVATDRPDLPSPTPNSKRRQCRNADSEIFIVIPCRAYPVCACGWRYRSCMIPIEL